MPTSIDNFERWLDDMFGSHIKTYVSVNSVSTKNEPVPVLTKPITVSPFEIQSVLSNRKKNAFTVVWADGTSTVVHCQPGDEWDDEKALAMCFTKKALGNKGSFNDKFNDALDNKMKVIPAADKVVKEEVEIWKEALRPLDVPEKACDCDCDCDGACEKCECKEETKADETLTKLVDEVAKMSDPVEIGKSFKVVSKKMEDARNSFGLSKQTADELTKATIKADKSLKEMIDALTGETVPKTGKIEKAPLYRVFIRISGKSHHDSDFTSIESLRGRVHEIAEEYYGRKPYYYRSWIGDNGRMIIDFGHYTQFIEIEGITPSEYAKN